MITFCEYDSATGQIVAVRTASDEASMAMQPIAAGMEVVVAEGSQQIDTDLWYCLGGHLTMRPTLGEISRTQIPADDTTEAVVGDVPIGTEMYVDDAPMGVADDGLVEFSAVDPKVYEIRLVPPFPTLPRVYTVTAT